MITELNEQNFEENTKKGLKLIEFYAGWCCHCARQHSVLNELDKIWIGQIDTDKEQNLAKQFSVSSLPTFLIMKDGKEMFRFYGYHSAYEIMEILNKYIK